MCRLLALPLIPLLLTGCTMDQVPIHKYAVRVLIKLKPDGSGTIEYSVLIDKEEMAKQRKQWAEEAKEGGAREDARKKEKTFFNGLIGKLKGDADLGEEVSFVSAAKVKTQYGEGVQLVYSLRNINKVFLSARAVAVTDKKTQRYAFKPFKKENGKAVLKIKNNALSVKGTNAALLKHFFRDILKKLTKTANRLHDSTLFKIIRYSFQLEILGKIVKTNAAYVKGNRITLFEYDDKTFWTQGAQLKKLAEKEPKTLEEAQKMFKTVKGFKVDLHPEITVEFTAD